MGNVKLLDCTLRDGGYVNDWNWGFGAARDIVATLTRAGVDIVEVGFLRNIDAYTPDRPLAHRIEDLNRLLPAANGRTMYAGMAMRSNYDITQLSPYSGEGIELIRITAHDYDIREGMDFAREVKARGYKLSINPINIMGYADKDILWILDQVNAIAPYQFSIVDTFGSMRRRDLERILSLVDHDLDPAIRVGLHLHENMALSFCLAQEFIDKHLRRDITVDASLLGMGRIPGNLPIELIADYMNDTLGASYDIDELMDAIQDHIAPIKGNPAWGYTPAYFLSARYNLHRNYAEHFLAKGDLTNRDINHILGRAGPQQGRRRSTPPMPTGCTATIRAAMWTTRPRWLRCAPPLRANACWCWPRAQPWAARRAAPPCAGRRPTCAFRPTSALISARRTLPFIPAASGLTRWTPPALPLPADPDKQPARRRSGRCAHREL